MTHDISDQNQGFQEQAQDLIRLFELDFDGDGIVDEILFGMDNDGDGVIDQFFREVDLNQDGIADGFVSVAEQIDLDGESFTRMEMVIDCDGDHQFDAVINGVFDASGENGALVVFADPDGDHIWEAEEQYLLRDEDLVELPKGEKEPADAYEPFDPSAADMSSILGDPESYMDNWHAQETPFSCAVVTQEIVMEELLGISVEEAELRRIAVENGWLSEGGTYRCCVGRLLEYMGLDVHVSQGNSFADLCDCLSRGVHPIVSVDSEELWNGINEELYMPGDDSNHSVQVIGVDLTDSENPMVILNDSGVSNGCGAMVSAEVFMGAWEDSGCFMVEAYV